MARTYKPTRWTEYIVPCFFVVTVILVLALIVYAINARANHFYESIHPIENLNGQHTIRCTEGQFIRWMKENRGWVYVSKEQIYKNSVYYRWTIQRKEVDR